MITSGQSVPVVLSPTGCGLLVVPSAMVCEVVVDPKLSAVPGTHDWVVGYFIWRGVSVSLITVEKILGCPDIQEISKVIVLYPLQGRRSDEFFAIATSGEPHTSSIGVEAKLATSTTLTSRYVSGLLELSGGLGYILDFNALAAKLYPA